MSERDEISRLENFIKDRNYKEQLIKSANVYPWVPFELKQLKKLEVKVKEKMKVPLKSTLRFERTKCSKDCSHNHEYFYAYFWDYDLQKLKKKIIGKSLLNAE